MCGSSAPGVPDKLEMIRLLFENSSELIHVTDVNERLLLVNDAWQRLTGLSEAELLGRPGMDFVHPEDIVGLKRLARAEPGSIIERELRIRTADGDWRWFAGRRQTLADGRRLVIMRDATAMRARARELEEARRTRKLLGVAAGIGAWTYDPVDRRVVWSDELLKMVGRRRREVATPAAFLKLLHARERAHVQSVYAQAVADGQPGQLEHRLKGTDGWLVMRSTFRSHRLPDGRFALHGISEDITELARNRDAARLGERQMRRARREAQAAATRLKMALRAAMAGVYEIDHTAKTFWMSPELRQLLGGGETATYDEVKALEFPQFHPDDRDLVRANFRTLTKAAEPSGEAFECRVVRADGEVRWIRVFHDLRVSRNGRWGKAVGLVQDIDARKRQELALVEAEKAAQAGAEAKAAFLANMSHEIRTPMNGVMGVLHLLKSEALSAEGRQLLEEALSCGAMLAELLNDVIDFSKIEAGRLELAPEPLDVPALVRGVAHLLKPQAEAKGLALICEVDPAVGWAKTDPVRLRQALFNLIGNAVKFTEVGEVRVRCLAPRPSVLRFEIEDTGVGIPEEAQSRIFRRFDQGDASTTRRFGGSGLGLTITQRLAEMMGGDIGFVSREGAGSTFWIEVAAEPADAAAAETDALQTVLEGLRILVVEDNSTNRMIATKVLESLGAEVSTAEDGYLGVEAAAIGAYDLILMDVQMPGIDGLEATRRIRALAGPAAATPILALTANVLSHQKAHYLDAGMNGLVGKPISPAALIAEIARLGEDAAQTPGQIADQAVSAG